MLFSVLKGLLLNLRANGFAKALPRLSLGVSLNSKIVTTSACYISLNSKILTTSASCIFKSADWGVAMKEWGMSVISHSIVSYTSYHILLWIRSLACAAIAAHHEYLVDSCSHEAQLVDSCSPQLEHHSLTTFD